MIKNICVFCSSSNDLAECYFNAAETLAELFSANDFNLIHGGGNIGLMGALMRRAAELNVEITGVVPEKLNQSYIVCNKRQKIVVTKDMKERKEYMRNNSDAFVAMPGGFGTLEELLEVITLKQLKYHTKPIVMINTYNFFNHLLEHFEETFLQNFANEEYRELYYVANTPIEAINYIKNYKYSNIYDKYLRQ
jgi:uncharacterized protein (TIGR00730 family)